MSRLTWAELLVDEAVHDVVGLPLTDTVGEAVCVGGPACDALLAGVRDGDDKLLVVSVTAAVALPDALAEVDGVAVADAL